MLEKHVYCVKCQSGRTIIDQTPVTMQNGSAALKGKCPKCDSVAYKIVSKDALKNEPAPVASNPKPSNSDNHLVLALATFAFGLAIGSAIAMYL